MKRTSQGVSWKSFALLGMAVSAALLFSNRAGASLAVDSTSNASSAGAVNSLSWVHTTNTSTSGQNTLLVVGVSINGTSTVSSVTMGATLGSIGSNIPSDDKPSNLTLATSKNSTNNLTRMEIWYLLAPPVLGTTAGAQGSEPTLQIKVTLSGGATKSMVAGAVYFTGAMQVAPTAWTATTAATGNASITGTSNATDIVVDTIATVGTSTSVTPAGTQTSQWNVVTATGATNEIGGGSTKTNATSMSWTIGTNTHDWAMGAVVVQASANTRFTATRINMDDLYGIDSNNPANSGPHLSPIGVHVTNNGAQLTDVSVTITLFDTPNSCGSGGTTACVTLNNSTFTSQTIPASGSFDYYFILNESNLFDKNNSKTSINKAFSYVITIHSATVSATDDLTLSSGMEMVIDLVSQNRNTTDFTSCNGISTVTGSNPGSIFASVQQGQEFQCTISSTSTGSGAFHTMRIWQDWNGSTFVIDKVDTNYSTSFKYNPPSPDCYNNGCGGSGVTYTQTVTLRAIGSVGSSQVVTPFILDDSGSSFHYNSGAGVTATITITTPTAVKLRSFDATRAGGDTLLSWKTGREVNNLGFRIYRDSPDGQRVIVTPELVAGNVLFSGQHLELSSGNSYHFLDRGAPAGATYYLEDVDIRGASTLSRPATAREVESPSLFSSFGGAETLAGADNSPTVSDVASRFVGGSRAPEGLSVHSLDDGEAETEAAKASGGQSLQFSIASGAGAKVSVREEGWYRVTRQDLKAAGWDPGANPDKLQLYVEGAAIPMLVTNLGGGNYSMEFYGTGLDTVATDTRVYWIVPGTGPGSRLANKNFAGGSATGSDFPFTVSRKDRVVYVPGILNGDAESWYGPIVGPSWFTPADQSVDVAHLNTSNNGQASLALAIEGATADVLHTIDVTVNGNAAGTLTFKGQGHFQSTLSIPVSWLVEGSNSILLQEEGNSNFSIMDSVALTYPHVFKADSDALGFTVSGSRKVSVAGFTIPGVRVFDVTNPAAVMVLPSSVGPDGSGGYAVTVSTPAVAGKLHLLAVADDRISAPADLESNSPSKLNDKKGSADFVMISHPSFVSALGPLASLRQSQGLSTQIVDVSDVYDEFSYGEKDPAAIKAFLQWTKANWKKAPKYVLLVGDGSYDPRDYFGIGTTDFVPAKLVSTVYLKTASDDWYVDFNNDSLPDMAIGRLPAETPSDAATMISKIVGYESASPSSSVLLVGDHEDENDFHGEISVLKSLVAGKTAQTICIDPDPVDASYPNIGPCVNSSTAHGQILDAFNAGQSVVNWVGHGEPTSWSKSDVFDTSDVPSLGNFAHLPLALTMDCLNGYFHDPNTESFAEALLRAPNGGAVAVWASSSLTLFESQSPVNQTLFQLLFTTPAPRLGDAVKTAKGVTSDSDVRRTWVFFGDPTMKLR